MRPLAGRVAVVGGASRGIGLAAAESLADAGATVARMARSLESGRSGRFLDVRCDLSRPDEVAGAALRVAKEAGPPDIVVAASGAFALAPIEATSAAELDAQFAANVRAPFSLIRAFLPALRETRGAIVLVGSVADHLGLPGNSAYATSKYALRGLHETLVAELRGTGVRCSLLSPGATDTSLWDPIGPDERADLPDRASMLRAGDVAEAVLFLATRPAHVHVDWLRIGPA